MTVVVGVHADAGRWMFAQSVEGVVGGVERPLEELRQRAGRPACHAGGEECGGEQPVR
jgi:hypothetical protein